MAHPNIIQICEIFEDNTNFYIITEYFDGVTLSEKFNQPKMFSEGEIFTIFEQIMAAVNACHEMNICHRDLKPDNILVGVKNQVKILDFGGAVKFSGDEELRGYIGTPEYMAPEVRNNLAYNEKCDIWSVGAILYTFLTG